MLAIVIVSYKSNDQTRRFVAESLRDIQIPYRVVVVNNGAAPGESTELQDSLGSLAHVIDNPVNSGFAIGCNIGARYAVDTFGADKILFSNNDIKLLDPDVVQKMSALLDKEQSAGIVGPRIVGLDGNLQSPEPYISFAKRHIWMYLCTPFISKKRKREIFALDYSENAEEGFHYKLMGSFFMVRACDFVRCGMMDEGTFLYSEEPILTERMAALGLKPYYLPSVSVLHEHGKTISNTFSSRKQDAMLFESEVYYYRKYKHVGAAEVLIARLIRKILYIAGSK